MAKWVGVKERLPQTGMPVLCIGKSKNYFIGSYLGANYSNEYAAFKHIEKCMSVGVSHWMPLPEPPESNTQ